MDAGLSCIMVRTTDERGHIASAGQHPAGSGRARDPGRARAARPPAGSALRIAGSNCADTLPTRRLSRPRPLDTCRDPTLWDRRGSRAPTATERRASQSGLHRPDRPAQRLPHSDCSHAPPTGERAHGHGLGRYVAQSGLCGEPAKSSLGPRHRVRRHPAARGNRLRPPKRRRAGPTIALGRERAIDLTPGSGQSHALPGF